MSSDAIVDFYLTAGSHGKGRTIEEVWSWDVDQLESVHDYIQWLFPLPKPSAFNPSAPLVTAATIAAFHDSPLLRQRLRRSLRCFLRFLGFELVDGIGGSCEVVLADDFHERSSVWLSPGNHNHLRLSRALESVRLLGLPEESRALLKCLSDLRRRYPDRISEETFRYWRRAAGES